MTRNLMVVIALAMLWPFGHSQSNTDQKSEKVEEVKSIGAKIPVEAGDGVIKGKAVYDGTPPRGMIIAAMPR